MMTTPYDDEFASLRETTSSQRVNKPPSLLLGEPLKPTQLVTSQQVWQSAHTQSNPSFSGHQLPMPYNTDLTRLNSTSPQAKNNLFLSELEHMFSPLSAPVPNRTSIQENDPFDALGIERRPTASSTGSRQTSIQLSSNSFNSNNQFFNTTQSVPHQTPTKTSQPNLNLNTDKPKTATTRQSNLTYSPPPSNSSLKQKQETLPEKEFEWELRLGSPNRNEEPVNDRRNDSPIHFGDDRFAISNRPTGNWSNNWQPSPQDLKNNYNTNFPTVRGKMSVRRANRHIYCDGCGAFEFEGARYKCAVCPDYDLCANCQAAKKHPQHPMKAIRMYSMIRSDVMQENDKKNKIVTKLLSDDLDESSD